MPRTATVLAGKVADACTAGDDARSLWGRLGKAGILSQVCPASGAERVEPVRLDELLTELDDRLPLGLVLSVCVQVATVLPLLRTLADHSAFAAEIHHRALHGEAVVALAATDSAVSGSDLPGLVTALRNTPDGEVLDGGKEWITNARHCDYALVLTRHRPGRQFTSFCWVLLPADRRGLRCESAGSRFADAGIGHLRFDAVPVEPANRVGSPGRALAEFVTHIAAERLAGAVWARALTRRALTATHKHLAAVPSGDGVLWDNAAIRERFAICVVEWRKLDALCAGNLSSPLDLRDAMVLKVASAQTVERILAECVSLLGKDAFADGGMASLREQAVMFGTAGGATGAMLAGIADRPGQLLRPRGDPDDG